MSNQELLGLLSTIRYVDAPPDLLRSAVRQANALKFEITNAATAPDASAKRLGELQALTHKVQELTAVRHDGSRTKLKELLERMHGSRTGRVDGALTATNVYQVSPWKELGDIAVATSPPEHGNANLPRLREVLPAIARETRSSTLTVPQWDEKNPLPSHSILLYTNWSWWDVWPVYEHFSASARMVADGWDAADIAGGDRALAKQLCLTLDPQGNVWLALLKAAACQYANAVEVDPTRPSRLEG